MEHAADSFADDGPTHFPVGLLANNIGTENVVEFLLDGQGYLSKMLASYYN